MFARNEVIGLESQDDAYVSSSSPAGVIGGEDCRLQLHLKSCVVWEGWGQEGKNRQEERNIGSKMVAWAHQLMLKSELWTRLSQWECCHDGCLVCFKAVSEALFEDLCHRRQQFEEDLWVEKEIAFSPDTAPLSR